MNDLIRRQAAIEIARQEIDSGTYTDITWKLEALPSVEPKKGEWLSHPTEREWDVCSHCGTGVHRREYGLNENGTEWVSEMSYMFCPWCGADMRGEQK